MASYVIIGICAVVYFAYAGGMVSRGAYFSMALWPAGTDFFGIWQMISYGFLHGSFNHLFFNMFAVWMFGLQLERSWGTHRYLQFYAAGLIAAGIAQLVVQAVTGEVYPTVGASGAVFALLLGYGVMWPNNRVMLIFFPVPIKAKWFVVIYGVIELVLGATGAMPGVAHFAHLGGLLGGAALLYFWGWRPGMTWRR